MKTIEEEIGERIISLETRALSTIQVLENFNPITMSSSKLDDCISEYVNLTAQLSDVKEDLEIVEEVEDFLQNGAGNTKHDKLT